MKPEIRARKPLWRRVIGHFGTSVEATRTRMPLWRRILRRLAFGLVALIVLFLAARSVWLFVTARAIKEELAAIRAAGEPVTFEDLDRAHAKIDAGDDAARFYLAAISLMEGTEEEEDLLSIYVAKAEQWPLELPKDGAQEHAERLLGRNEQVLELVDKAALLPECRYDMRVRQGAKAVLEGIDGPRNLASLATLRVVHKALRKEGDAALSAVVSAVRLSRVFEREPTLILHLLATGLRTQAIGKVPLVLESGPSDAALVRLEEALRAADRPERLSDSLLVERVFSLLFSKNIFVGTLTLNMPDGSFYGQFPVNFGNRPFFQSMALGYLRDLGKFLRASRQPWPEILGAFEKIQAESQFGKMLQSGWEHTLASIGRSLTVARSARVAVFVERYRLANGRFPESLAELDTAFAESLPSDPYSGGSLILRREDGSYTVYGVGANQKDDGGAVKRDEQGESLDVGVRVRQSR